MAAGQGDTGCPLGGVAGADVTQLTQIMSISLAEASKAMTSFSGIFQAV
jgi:hypothetical protein